MATDCTCVVSCVLRVEYSTKAFHRRLPRHLVKGEIERFLTLLYRVYYVVGILTVNKSNCGNEKILILWGAHHAMLIDAVTP